MGELGLFGLPFAEKLGGTGGDFLSYCIAIEELARADAGVAVTLEAGVSLGAAPIHDFGTAEQKERWLPDLLAGRRLWAFGLTEPGSGSDAGAIRTRPRLDQRAARAPRRARLRRAARVPKARLALLRHPPAGLRRLSGGGGEPARATGRGVPAVPADDDR